VDVDAAADEEGVDCVVVADVDVVVDEVGGDYVDYDVN